MEEYIPKQDTRTRTFMEGVYYKVAGDNRVHQDVFMLYHLNKLIPQVQDDVCPKCGNRKGVTSCRCPDSHRYCDKCGATWRYEIDKRRAIIVIVYEKPLTE